MKILHVIPNLGSGGAERFVVDLLNNLTKEHNVILCTLYDLKDGENDYFFHLLSKDIKVISLGKRLGIDLKVVFNLYRIIRKIKPDVIHTHLSSVNYTLLNVFFFRSIKYYHTIHNTAEAEVKSIFEFITRKWMYKNSFIIPITISYESSKSFQNYYHLQNDLIIPNVISNVISSESAHDVKCQIDSFRPTEKTKILLNVGRFVSAKNQINLANVIKDLINEGYDLVLIIIGNYDYPGGLKIYQAIDELQCSRIRLMGYRKNVGDYLLYSDAFCLASHFEGLPITLLEAMSAGCIPICTPVGGIPSIINSSKFGFLAEGCDNKFIKKAIIDFLTSESISEIRSNIMEKYKLNYTIAISTKSHDMLYKTNKN